MSGASAAVSSALANESGLVVLDPSVSGAVHASYTVIDITQAIHELVSNAFEADATNVAVIFDAKTPSFEVHDDGIGIHPNDVSGAIGVHLASSSHHRHGGNKTHSRHGATLVSLGQLGRLEIISRCAGQPFAGRKVVLHGDVVFASHHWSADYPQTDNNQGTSVRLDELFSTIPVRRKQMAEEARRGKTSETIRRLLLKLVLVRPSVGLRLQLEGRLVLEHTPCNSVQEAIVQHFGVHMMDAMAPVVSTRVGSHLAFCIEGFASDPQSDASTSSTKQLQAIVINGRLVWDDRRLRTCLNREYKSAVAAIQKTYICQPSRAAVSYVFHVTCDDQVDGQSDQAHHKRTFVEEPLMRAVQKCCVSSWSVSAHNAHKNDSFSRFWGANEEHIDKDNEQFNIAIPEWTWDQQVGEWVLGNAAAVRSVRYADSNSPRSEMTLIHKVGVLLQRPKTILFQSASQTRKDIEHDNLNTNRKDVTLKRPALLGISTLNATMKKTKRPRTVLQGQGGTNVAVASKRKMHGGCPLFEGLGDEPQMPAVRRTVQQQLEHQHVHVNSNMNSSNNNNSSNSNPNNNSNNNINNGSNYISRNGNNSGETKTNIIHNSNSTGSIYNNSNSNEININNNTNNTNDNNNNITSITNNNNNNHNNSTNISSNNNCNNNNSINNHTNINNNNNISSQQANNQQPSHASAPSRHEIQRRFDTVGVLGGADAAVGTRRWQSAVESMPLNITRTRTGQWAASKQRQSNMADSHAGHMNFTSSQGQSMSGAVENGKNEKLEQDCCGGGAHNTTAAESTRVTKQMLLSCRLIAQVDCKFLLATCGQTLLAFDQHAVHERIRLEMFEKAIHARKATQFEGESAVAYSSEVSSCIVLLDELQLVRLRQFQTYLTSWGFEWKNEDRKGNKESGGAGNTQQKVAQYEGSGVILTRLPVIFGAVLGSKQFVESIEHAYIVKGNNNTIPRPFQRVLARRACRGAVMFGDPLSNAQSVKLLSDLTACNFPFQCAHGRPSLAPLLAVQSAKQRKKRSVAGKQYAALLGGAV